MTACFFMLADAQKEVSGQLFRKKLQKPCPKSNPKFTKLCPVKLFLTKGDLLMDLSPFGFIQIPTGNLTWTFA